MSLVQALLSSSAAAFGAIVLLIRRQKDKRNTIKLCTKEEAITKFDDPRLKWDNGSPVNNGGHWSVDKIDGSLTISPEPRRDYWSRTFYSPLLVKTDAQTLLATVPVEKEIMLTTAFTLTPISQFDQAGIMIRVDDRCWVKAGIEFTDGIPRLSCVVTNDGYSDWSTQTWELDDEKNKNIPVTTSIRARVSKLFLGSEQGPSLVFEATTYTKGSTAESEGEWRQIRIASLRSGSKPWNMGIFAICPVINKGCKVKFHHINFGDPIMVHSAENPLDG